MSAEKISSNARDPILLREISAKNDDYFKNLHEKGSARMFFYGSLRKAEYNFRFIAESQPVGIFRVMGVRLMAYQYGAYPFAFHTNDDDDSTLGEVYEVPKEKVMAVRQMEQSAGYTERFVTLPDGTSAMFFVGERPNKDLVVVPDGDWSKRKR